MQALLSEGKPMAVSDSTDAEPTTGERGVWTFLSNHALVIMEIARNPEARLRDVADSIQITERAVQRIVTDLVEAGYITRSRNGRRNVYVVHMQKPLLHPIAPKLTVGDLVRLANIESDGVA